MHETFTKEQFNAIMNLADKIEELVEGNDFTVSIEAINVVLSRGGRAVRGQFEENGIEPLDADKFAELIALGIDFWWGFYDHLDLVNGEKQ